MDAAHFIAAIIGPLYLAVAVGILLDPAHYRRMAEEFLQSPPLVYLGGACAFAIGLSILLFHHAWSSDWRVLVTLVGWLAFLKGAHLLIAPGYVFRLWTPLLSRSGWLRAAALIIGALGAFLSVHAYAGFWS